MRTRVHRLKGEGVSAAWFYLDKGERFILGRKPHHPEMPADDFVAIKESRFLVAGKTLTKNTYNEYTMEAKGPLPDKANPFWAEVIGEEDGTIGFCLSTSNAKHRVISAGRLILAPGEEHKLTMSGYLTVAENDVLIEGESVGLREIIRLSGKPLTLVGGEHGCQIGFVEIEFLE